MSPGRRRKNSWSIIGSDPLDADIGKRKLSLTMYLIRKVLHAAGIEFFFYIILRKWGGFDKDELLDLFKLINTLLISGFGIALGVYSATNIGEWKFRNGSSGPIDSEGQGYMGHGEYAQGLPSEEGKDGLG